MTNKAQLIRDNATLRESNKYLHAQLKDAEVTIEDFYKASEREDSELRGFLADLLVLDPTLARFQTGCDCGDTDWDFERTHRAAEFARGHEALHSVEREPDIEIHIQEAAA